MKNINKVILILAGIVFLILAVNIGLPGTVVMIIMILVTMVILSYLRKVVTFDNSFFERKSKIKVLWHQLDKLFGQGKIKESEYRDLEEKYTVQLQLDDMFEHRKIDKDRYLEIKDKYIAELDELVEKKLSLDVTLENLKERQNKLVAFMQKLDDRHTLGEIDENNYKEFHKKYKAELDNLRNRSVEKELLREVGIQEKEVEKEVLAETKKEYDKKIISYKNDNEKKGSAISAFFWMLLLSILFFWLPIIGSLFASFVGGRKAGSIGNAILAALSPAIMFFFLFTTTLSPLLTELLGPILGILLGTTLGGIIGIIVLIDSIILIIGAIMGAL